MIQNFEGKKMPVMLELYTIYSIMIDYCNFVSPYSKNIDKELSFYIEKFDRLGNSVDEDNLLSKSSIFNNIIEDCILYYEDIMNNKDFLLDNITMDVNIKNFLKSMKIPDYIIVQKNYEKMLLSVIEYFDIPLEKTYIIKEKIYKSELDEYVKNEEYEKAAEIRDKLILIEKIKKEN